MCFSILSTGVGGVLRVRRPGRAGRTAPAAAAAAADTHPEAGEPAERGRVVQLRVRERGRHVQDRDQVPDGRGVRQVRVRGRDGQAADGRVRRVGPRLRAGRHRHHRAAARVDRRLQRPARRPPPAAAAVGRLRRRTVPRGPQRVLQVRGGRAAKAAAAAAGGADRPATAVVHGPRAKGEVPGLQDVPGASVRAELRPVDRIVFHLVLGMRSGGRVNHILKTRRGFCKMIID